MERDGDAVESPAVDLEAMTWLKSVSLDMLGGIMDSGPSPGAGCPLLLLLTRHASRFYAVTSQPYAVARRSRLRLSFPRRGGDYPPRAKTTRAAEILHVTWVPQRRRDLARAVHFSVGCSAWCCSFFTSQPKKVFRIDTRLRDDTLSAAKTANAQRLDSPALSIRFRACAYAALAVLVPSKI
uniref:Uncharacterized protein n=1 Tax=Oryza glumipatula TaxID=40148 RepID=A0A0D9YA21_9ORYZ